MPSQANSVRIIAGDWRGTRISIPAATSVRPTPDRVRETLFNWLSPSLAGTRCLDLLAGTGVLGLEALSRGARESWFVESDSSLVRCLQRQIEDLDANGHVVREDVTRFLQRPNSERFDLVFLDPPYERPLGLVLEQLATWLSPGARVYIERAETRDAGDTLEELAASLADAELLKEGRAASVRFGLLGLPK